VVYLSYYLPDNINTEDIMNKLKKIFFVIGLLTGLVACFLIFRDVVTEWSTDGFFEHAQRVYRVVLKIEREADTRFWGTTAPPLAPALVREVAGVESAVRLRYARTSIVRYKGKSFYLDRLFYADPAIFHILSYPFASGKPGPAPEQPDSIVLSHNTAERLFGSRNPVGEHINVEGIDLIVTGVLEPLTGTSHLNADGFISFATFKVPEGFEVTLDSWNWNSFYTYVLLKPGSAPESMEKEITLLLNRHREAKSASGPKLYAYLQPLKRIYFETDVKDFYGVMLYGNESLVYMLFLAGFIFLFFTAFNFWLPYLSGRRHKDTGRFQRPGVWGKLFCGLIILFQVTIAVGLTAAALATGEQMAFIRQKDLGFDAHRLLVFDLPGSYLKDHYQRIKETLLTIPGIENVSAAGELLDGKYGTHPVEPEKGAGTQVRHVRMAVAGVYPGYFKTLGVRMVSGTGFPPGSAAGNGPLRFVINQTAAKQLKLEQPVGKKLRILPYKEFGEIVGVTEDFHFAPLHVKITPVIFSIPTSAIGKVYVRIAEGEELPAIRQRIDQAWIRIAPDFPFSSKALRPYINGSYGLEQRIAALTCSMAIPAIIIALVGVWGLMGSGSSFKLTALIILIANGLAFAAVYPVMGQWLNSFAYTAGMPLPSFVIVSLVSFLPLLTGIVIDHRINRTVTHRTKA
jgi:hypothetical protein